MQKRKQLLRGGVAASAAAATAAALLSVASVPSTGHAADVPAVLDIDLGRKGAAIPPTFGGLMTEEINHSYDGGLFAELIQNRTFQDPAPRGWSSPLPVHWLVLGNGKASIEKNDPVNPALPNSLRLDLAGGASGVANDGYWGIPIRPNTTYTASFYAKSGGGFTGPITAALALDGGSTSVAAARTGPISGAWRKYTVTLKTGRDVSATAKARFVLLASGTGSVSFSLVSLFPPTYQNVANGLRPDLMELMAGLKPAFIRLPGGNYVEGSTFATRFNWKQMIGPADQRPGHQGCWGYRSSDGFGMPEYLLWCKQLNAEPVLALFAGYVLNHDHVDAGSPEMAQYTQEALEEIEYVSGPATSEWGKRRAADGFPEPFPLHYVEIGNEDWFDRSGSYDGRFTEMARAIRARYPNLKIIATAPVKSFKPDLYDDHFYRNARTLIATGRQYDPRTDSSPPLRFNGGGWNGRQSDGIQTFVGEWATQEGRPTPDLNAGLADAAFVMELEQNADAIPIECYAPLFVNVSPADPARGYPRAWQWNTNLIGYDALHSFGSPSYYAQAMLAQNRGDTALLSTLSFLPTAAAAAATPTAAAAPHGGIGVGTWHTQNEYRDITVTTPDGRTLMAASAAPPDPNTWKTAGGRWRVQDGAMVPANGDSESWAMFGDPGWTDYTIHLRARKQSGREGFLVLFRTRDDANYRWWNIGGWDNTLTRFEAAENGDRNAYGPSVPFRVEPDRWYDLRLEVTGSRVRGYIDDKLVTEVREEPRAAAAPSPAVATATYDSGGHVVLIKVVNPGSDPLDLTVRLRGADQIDERGTATVLSGEPDAVNTIDQPIHVAPKQETVTGVGSEFRRTFPPHSFTLLRVKASAK